MPRFVSLSVTATSCWLGEIVGGMQAVVGGIARAADHRRVADPHAPARCRHDGLALLQDGRDHLVKPWLTAGKPLEHRDVAQRGPAWDKLTPYGSTCD